MLNQLLIPNHEDIEQDMIMSSQSFNLGLRGPGSKTNNYFSSTAREQSLLFPGLPFRDLLPALGDAMECSSSQTVRTRRTPMALLYDQTGLIKVVFALYVAKIAKTFAQNCT